MAWQPLRQEGLSGPWEPGILLLATSCITSSTACVSQPRRISRVSFRLEAYHCATPSPAHGLNWEECPGHGAGHSVWWPRRGCWLPAPATVTTHCPCLGKEQENLHSRCLGSILICVCAFFLCVYSLPTKQGALGFIATEKVCERAKGKVFCFLFTRLLGKCRFAVEIEGREKKKVQFYSAMS